MYIYYNLKQCCITYYSFLYIDSEIHIYPSNKTCKHNNYWQNCDT